MPAIGVDSRTRNALFTYENAPHPLFIGVRYVLTLGPKYDFVYGPVANDNVYRTLNLYRSGEIDREETLKRLKIRKLYNQLVFASDKALGFIRFLRSEVVS